MGSSLSNIQVQLERTTYLPGNLIRGVVIASAKEDVPVNSLHACFLSEMVQRYKSGGKNKTTHTVRTPLCKQAIPLQQASSGSFVIPAGESQFPFAFQLAASALPTASVIQGSTKLFVVSRIAVEADIKGAAFNRSGEVNITILSAMPQAVHASPVPRQVQQTINIDCCGCCCSRGSIDQSVQVDRSVFALDRDKLNFNVAVTNNSKEELGGVKAKLVAHTVPKVGGRTNVAPAQVMFEQLVPFNPPIKPGCSGQATGQLQLNMLAPASVTSNVLDINYHIAISATTSCCVEDSTINLAPVLVAHTVDMSQAQFAQQTMNAYAQPSSPVTGIAMDQAGYGLTQNLYFGQQAVPQWTPGAPPMGAPPAMPMAPQQGGPGYGTPLMQDQYQQQQQQMPPPQQQQPTGYDANNFAAFGAFAPPPPDVFQAAASCHKYEHEM